MFLLPWPLKKLHMWRGWQMLFHIHATVCPTSSDLNIIHAMIVRIVVHPLFSLIGTRIFIYSLSPFALTLSHDPPVT